MNVSTKIKMDLTKPILGLTVHAVQGDAYSRDLQIALYRDLSAWTIPTGTTVSVRYAKPDKTQGYYDTMPDGTSAWSFQDNILTVQLAPQVLTVAGCVKVQIELVLGTHILSTFTLNLYVEADPSAGVLKSEDYVNWLQWIQEQSVEYAESVQMSASDAASAAKAAETAAVEATTSAATADNACKKTEAVAENVAAIIAGNEAYTKQESNLRYSPAIVETVSGEIISISDSVNAPLAGLTIFGKTVHDGTPTLESPAELISVGKIDPISLRLTGKNILAPNDIGHNETAGFIAELLSDGSVIVNGTNAKYNGYCFISKLVLHPGKYMLTGCPKNGSAVTYALSCQKSSGSFVGYDTGNGLAITVTNTETYEFLARINAGYEADNLIFYPQLEIASAATAYEPYTEQSLSVQIPNGLHGIPVDASGNHTDVNDQQWICDEIDFSRSVITQRIGWIDSYAGEDVGNHWISSTGTLSTNAAVCYVLDTPVDISLEDQAQTSYSSLRMLYPSTVIHNDANAEMAVRYIADTKLYIDRYLTGGTM